MILPPKAVYGAYMTFLFPYMTQRTVATSQEERALSSDSCARNSFIISEVESLNTYNKHVPLTLGM